MRIYLLLFLCIASVYGIQAQDHEVHHDSGTHEHRERKSQEGNGFGFGLEQDVLPYILGGYIATAWLGKDHLRGRFSFAKSNIPGFYRADEILKDRVTAFGINFEYFVKQDFRGLWFGLGYGMWTNDVEFISENTYVHLSNIVSVGGGYNYHITNRIYISPWLALHTRIDGTSEVFIDSDRYIASRLTPEVSMKIGVRLF